MNINLSSILSSIEPEAATAALTDILSLRTGNKITAAGTVASVVSMAQQNVAANPNLTAQEVTKDAVGQVNALVTKLGQQVVGAKFEPTPLEETLGDFLIEPLIGKLVGWGYKQSGVGAIQQQEQQQNSQVGANLQIGTVKGNRKR